MTIQLLISAEVIYCVAIMCVKGSLLYLYHRVFYVSRGFRITTWIVVIFIVGYSIAQTFASIFQCTPIDANWKISVAYRCANTSLGATIISAFNALTDFIILIMPMPLLYKLQRRLREKVQIMCMFLLGGM